jgi:outer membrane protein OmpA-like peptidoglycan-associated protein
MKKGKPMRYKLWLVLFLLSATQAEAGLRQYSATLDQSTWALKQNSPLVCELSHPVPHFGEAFFRSMAGKELNMQFELNMLRLPDHYALAEVLSVPPVWRPGEQAKAISSMKMLKQFDGDLGKAESWIMLTELEQGYSPTFYFSDWYSPYDKVSVSLNPVHFIEAMDQFTQCVSALLPYTFDDIAFTVLTYESGGDELTKASKKRLEQIAQYLKHDQSIESIDIQAYSDSFGGRWMNEQLSIKRAEAIKTKLVSFGLEESRIRTEGLGEKRHVASNESSLGRAKNRRVVIQMEKP